MEYKKKFAGIFKTSAKSHANSEERALVVQTCMCDLCIQTSAENNRLNK